MSFMANRTFNTVLKHFSMVHLPTFRLIDTAACLAFAICTVGGIRSSNTPWLVADRPYQHADRPYQQQTNNIESMDGPLPPGQGWQSMFEQNFGGGDEADPDSKIVGEWESAHIVRNEKSNMLVKVCNFSSSLSRR